MTAPTPEREADQWLWRVFNQGWPKGHEDSTNEWGRWNLIPHADAERLAADDENNCYEFVPYRPADPRAALASAWPSEAQTEIERLTAALKVANANAEKFERLWYLRGDELEDLRAAPRPSVPQEAVAWPDVDQLAQYIRWLNGDNKMGAGALAESLLDWLKSFTHVPQEPHPAASPAEPGSNK